MDRRHLIALASCPVPTSRRCSAVGIASSSWSRPTLRASATVASRYGSTAKSIVDFPNLRLRDVDTLKIDHFELDFHAGNNPSGPPKKWYDAVVAAKRYIGPMPP
jgi:hypothetical protein